MRAHRASVDATARMRLGRRPFETPLTHERATRARADMFPRLVSRVSRARPEATRRVLARAFA